jgi:hypothetical protein
LSRQQYFLRSRVAAIRRGAPVSAGRATRNHYSALPRKKAIVLYRCCGTEQFTIAVYGKPARGKIGTNNASPTSIKTEETAP